MPTPTRWVVAVKHGIDVNLTRGDPVTGRIDLGRAPRKTSDFDRNAVEAAVRLRETHGGTVTIVCVGPPSASEALRDGLSLGGDEAVLLVPPEGMGTDSRSVALALAAHLRSSEGRFDLAFFGEGSTDHFSGTVGPRVAAELGLPSLCYVRSLVLEGDRVRVQRDVESGIEELEVSLPAIVTVGQEINTPRVPTFLSTLKASKKGIREIPWSDLGVLPTIGTNSITVKEATVPNPPRKRVRVAGTEPAAVAEELHRLLQSEGIGSS